MTIEPSVRNGIIAGALIAFVQATASVVALKWAWKRKSFYKVWAAGTMARFVVFALVALVVYHSKNLSFTATLLSLAIATMFFLIFEVNVFLKPK